MKEKKLYKFLRTGLKSEHGKKKWKIGEWYKEEDIKICNRGFHASKTPLQAICYVKGEILAEVEVKGKSIIEEDKECWSEMKITKAWYWTKEDSIELAIFSAEQVIGIFKKYDKNDDRPRKAIEAAKKYLEIVRIGGDTSAHAAAARAAYAAAHAADAAAAAAAAYAADAAAAAYAAYAAAHAAYAAYAADAAAHAAYAADAAYAAAHAAYAADAADAAAHAAAAAYAAYAAAHADARKKLIKKIDSWFIEKLNTLKPYEN